MDLHHYIQSINSVHPDTDGYFVFIGIGNGTYIVKPKLEGYGFDPLSSMVIVSDDDVTDLTFVAEEGLYISGKVTNFFGMGFKGVTLAIEGEGSASAQTNEDGIYSFTGLGPGEYIVTIDQGGYTSWPESRTVGLFGESKEDINFKLRTVCPDVFVNIPFIGSKGSLVNIFGNNFGWEEPEEGLTIVVGDTGVTLEAGVYFGSKDPETWVKADVMSWINFKIVAEAPAGFGIFNVWVLNETGCSYTSAMPTNFFILLP